MKKIMFSDRFGLTEAVLEGRKTMTRRIIPADVAKKLIIPGEPGFFPDVPCVGLYKYSRYKVGEVVAVAQAYKDIMPELDFIWKGTAAWSNKMFVQASQMYYHIRITNVRVERMQDISDEDCLREGIYNWKDAPDCPPGHKDSKIECYGYDGSWDGHLTPITAFAALIDKVSGKGTWASNPWVFVYEFELVSMKREEAIKIVRKNIPHLGLGATEMTEALKELIPELAESEDERIRKWLYDYISNCPNNNFAFYGGVGKDAVLNYLEKQKETPMPNSTELIEMWHKAKATLKEKDFRGDEWRLAQNAFMDGFARGTCVKFEKQKEQKLAEKQDYSGLNDLERAIHRGFLSAGVENVSITIIKETACECLAQMNPAEWNDTDMKEARDSLISVCRDWERGQKTTLLPIAAVRARYFLEHLTEPKPAEWSEEDQTRLTNILIMLQEYVIHHYSKDDVNKSVDWLKALPERFNLQPKQEWSEDDEKTYNLLLNHFQPAFEHRTTSLTREEIEKIYDFLKDLRLKKGQIICVDADRIQEYLPRITWQPSEEQMIALDGCLEHWSGNKCQKEILESLKEQLEKLM